MMKTNRKIKVFCDFDGTIAIKDLGDEIFKVFGEFDNYIGKLKSGEIDIKEYWNLVFASLKEEITLEEIKNFAITQEIDSNFTKFIDLCKTNDIELFIVSDGFDFYINPFFEAHGIENLKIYCNTYSINDSKKLKPIFPGAAESCKCFCASCKRNVVLNNSSDEEIIVYIGDGYSDYCGAEHSDIIFAKKNLAAYCNENRLPHYPYKNFFDIFRIFNDLLKKNQFKKRHQATLKRNLAFLAE
jgi:2-hydroxy-3-keto-5-methylthiopentenyl-1-phosphate phosphatase